MDSPPGSDIVRTTARSSVIDSIMSCTLAALRINKEDLKRRITIPTYLRYAINEAIDLKDISAGDRHDPYSYATSCDPQNPCECPLVVFINSKSGGRHGPELIERLQELMGEEQIFDLQFVKPQDFVQYGLGCLEKLADDGDSCAKEIREKLRVVVAGGDGTVGWILGCLSVLYQEKREPVPPTAIIPLGTGNDLSRSFCWGGSFPFNWKASVKTTLNKTCYGSLRHLDSWKLSILMPAEDLENRPHSLKSMEEYTIYDEALDIGESGVKMSHYEGVFYNYFSIGMDAQVAYGFHQLRNGKPYLAQGPISNKLIYSGYSCKQGWFFTQCMNDPNLRGLRNILRMFIKKDSCSEWKHIKVPSSVRSIVVLNLNNYASGRNPWGNMKPEYMEKKGFVEPSVEDGLLEIFGLKHGWHASFVMSEAISAKHLAQAAEVRFEFRGGEWDEAFVQMDGEPWKQPLCEEYSTFVDIKRVPFQSLMVDGCT
ncbi:diacylglycerol kinase 7-like [Impatiens glandulifera]|uniref:diacylglycerol kinase 7-like n=1 Tax=Impatiens glandulifera TaxID=253017 RepID=UPI001FB066E9|nr:diacylglycerol kinase 7-like [Impatiens glandulifera]